MVETVAECGVTGRGFKKGRLEWGHWNPRDYTTDKHRTVDDRPYGGGPGMVMKIEPLSAAIRAAKADSEVPAKVIYLTPQGRTLDQAAVQSFAKEQRLILVAGRYEGVDERVIESEIDEEWSVGESVLSGGELAALIMIDAVARLVPGVLGDEQSAEQDS